MKYFRYAALAALSAATALFCSCSGDTAADNASAGESNGGTIGVDFKGEPKISYVLPRFLNDAQTRSIYEVFTGDEINYGKLTMRTNPEKRAGMYFFVMFGYEPDDIALACTFELSVDSTADSKTRTYKFTVAFGHARSGARSDGRGLAESEGESQRVEARAEVAVRQGARAKAVVALGGHRRRDKVRKIARKKFLPKNHADKLQLGRV